MQSTLAPTGNPLRPEDSCLPQMTATPVGLCTDEDPNHPAGPPVYSWDETQDWWRCLLCNLIATPMHITSRKHRSKYADYVRCPAVLPPARPRPDQAARAAVSGSGTAPAPPPPPPPLSAQAMDGQSPAAGPAPAPPWAIDGERGIQQDVETVDQLICRLATLLEQANGVLAAIVRARRAHGRAVNAPWPPLQPWPSQDDPVRHWRDEPQQPQASPEGGEPQRDGPFGEAPQLTDGHGSAPRDGLPLRRQNGRWYGHSWWRDTAQLDQDDWSWGEWTDAGRE